MRPQRPYETLEQMVARLNAGAYVPAAVTNKENGMKVLTKKNVETLVKDGKAKAKARAASRQAIYDWDLILGGQHVELTADEDYVKTGKDKEGKEFDRTEMFSRAIHTRAADTGKKVDILFTETGMIVTARPMTEDEITQRDARKAKIAADKAAKAAAEANGQPHPDVHDATGDELEPELEHAES